MSKAQAFLHNWLRHRLVLVELVNAFPEEHLDYKPYEKAMSLKELVLHTVMSADSFIETVKRGELVRSYELGKPQVETMEDLRKLVHDVTEKNKTDITGLSEEAFVKLVDVSKIFGTSLSGEAILHIMRDHEIHHKGQLFVYARLIGMEEVPLFVKRDL
jgi:uncharacterized damage-inducible protein DinB